MGINGMFGIQIKPINKPTLGATGSLDYGRAESNFLYFRLFFPAKPEYQKVRITGG